MEITKANNFDQLIHGLAEVLRPAAPEPRAEHERKRLRTLFEAVNARLAEGQRVPEAWREEIWDLLRDYTEEAADED